MHNKKNEMGYVQALQALATQLGPFLFHFLQR